MPDNEKESQNSENSENSENESKESSNANANEDNKESENKEQSSENANQDKEPEFKDPEMQKAWTQKTQKLAEERKAWQAEIEKGKGETETLRRKAALLDRLDKDEEVVKFIYSKYGKKEEEKPTFTTEEMILAQSDPVKFEELINRAATKLVQPLKGRLGEFEMRETIEDYASQEGNEDFWTLHKAGLVKPQIVTLRSENPNLSNSELVKEAHLEARKLVNAIAKQEADKANGNVQKKKEAIGDKGGKNSVAGSVKSYKGKSIMEVGLDLVGDKK